MSTKQIASSTLWQVGSQVVMAALSIITVKFVAMGLSRELAGNYNSAYGFLQIFGILADFGLYAVAVREVSRVPERGSVHGKPHTVNRAEESAMQSSVHGKPDQPGRAEVMGALFVLRGIILMLSLLSALIIVWAIPAWRGTPFPLGVSIAALVPFFTLLAGIQRTVFQVNYKMHFVFIAEVTQRIVTVALIAAVIIGGVRDSLDLRVYEYFLAAGGAGAFVLFALSTYFARRLMPVKLTWNTRLLRELFVQAAPYGAAFFCTALYRQLDVTLIAAMRFDYDIQNAYYGFALRATEMAYLIPTFLLNSTLPILSARDARGEDMRDFVGKIFFAIVLLSTTAFLYAVFWARPVMRLLTTEDYLSTAAAPGSDTALSLLALPMLLNGIVLFCFYSMLTRHAWRPLVSTLAFGAILSLGLNIMMIPDKGFVGAAYASIGTHLFLAAALLPQALKILPIRLTRLHLWQWLYYTFPLGSFLLLTRPLLSSNLRTVVFLGLSGIVLAALAYATRITRELRVG